MLKRNTIVRAKEGSWFYGRVNRRVDAEHVEVICCGAHITIYRDDELDDCSDYKGYMSYRYGVWDAEGNQVPRAFVRMTSLRQLKQWAAYYDRRAWKRFRHLEDAGGHQSGSYKTYRKMMDARAAEST